MGRSRLLWLKERQLSCSQIRAGNDGISVVSGKADFFVAKPIAAASSRHARVIAADISAIPWSGEVFQLLPSIHPGLVGPLTPPRKI